VSASFAAFVAKNQLNKTSVKPSSRRDASIAAIDQNIALSQHSTAPNDIAPTPSNCRRVRTSGFGPVSQVFIFNGCNVHVAEGHERPVNGVELSRRTADCREHPQSTPLESFTPKYPMPFNAAIRVYNFLQP
jgi:hypothetical protein